MANDPEYSAHEQAQQDTCRKRKIEFDIISFNVEIAGKFTEIGYPRRENQDETHYEEHAPNNNKYFAHASHKENRLRVARSS
jgi:hypothetical protein